MTPLELCEAMYRALQLSGCWCTRTAPYHGMATKREIVQQCSRCKCIGLYEALTRETA